MAVVVEKLVRWIKIGCRFEFLQFGIKKLHGFYNPYPKAVS